jgi:CheY-like chemotaxis protein
MNENQLNPLVMLVDDFTIDNYINTKMLNYYGFSNRIMVYTSSRKAMDYLEQASEESPSTVELPAYIFLDLNMPDLDGEGFLEKFSALPLRVKMQCKVIILSSSVNPIDMHLMLRNKDVFMYLSKPLIKANIDELNMLIKASVYLNDFYNTAK